MKSYIVNSIDNIKGEINIDSDKSITHRAFLISALSTGNSIVKNPLRAEDCMHTLQALGKMGVTFKDEKQGIRIQGVGLRGLKTPKEDLYFGNSGTGFRLTAGMISGVPNLEAVLSGDESLTNRPMSRIIKPLKEMGANITARLDEYPPLKIKGKQLKSIFYELPVASAQVKSAILFAGLNADGTTKIKEPKLSRDHTENIFKFYGIDISRENNIIVLNPPTKIEANEVIVPADISSAAFFMVLAAIKSIKGLIIKNVGINPTRTGIITVLKRMGVYIEIQNERIICNERIGDIFVKKSDIKGIVLQEQEVPLLIDEIPILTLAAIYANGETIIQHAKELRFKESDRIKTIVTEFKKLGADIQELSDGFIVKGTNNLEGDIVNSHKDHRIAMSLIMAGMTAKGETKVDDIECINTSFPNFFNTVNELICGR